MLDVISPCVTFNDHEGSTKSYAYVKDHDDPLERDQLRAVLRGHHGRLRARHHDQEVTMHDGSKLFLKKLDEEYDPTDKIGGAHACCTRPRAAASSPPG